MNYLINEIESQEKYQN